MLANNFVLATTAVDCLTVHRQVQSFIRHERWFEDTLPNMPEYFFKQAFRVRPATFRYLVDVCRPYMERQVTCMRETIAMEKRVGVALFKLCSTAEDRTVATLFGIGRSTVNELYREFCETVVAVLEPEWVKLMTPKELPEHIREFQVALEFPQGVGALDGCHFAVSPPPQENASDYHNYKGWYSIILLALVDHRYRFRYVNVGAPGRCHDAHVFRRLNRRPRAVSKLKRSSFCSSITAFARVAEGCGGLFLFPDSGTCGHMIVVPLLAPPAFLPGQAGLLLPALWPLLELLLLAPGSSLVLAPGCSWDVSSDVSSLMSSDGTSSACVSESS
ncbi:hypothetical protein HPB47_017563 [Ixodes persulcatus]|uniref:Uncharacterized protein n=1 Tax=Ixodes persulcatus TaxID=34615 RepID=A0AC60QNY1_IXOPE|nr:hypothetical protein HPB47_017563 [Ixodes persulcatus]